MAVSQDKYFCNSNPATSFGKPESLAICHKSCIGTKFACPKLCVCSSRIRASERVTDAHFKVIARNDEGRSGWAGAPLDIRAREAWLDRRIRQGLSDGSLNSGDANRALRSLNSIRRQELGMRHYEGRLSENDQAYIQARLDTVSRNLR